MLVCLFAYSRICLFADTQQTTCSTPTPANKAALKALAIAEGGTTVVPNRACELSEGNIFSGECYGGVSNFSGLHELTSFGLGTFAVKSAKDVSPLRGGGSKRSRRRSYRTQIRCTGFKTGAAKLCTCA